MAKQKILIVEDEAIVAMEIEARLGKLGYDIAGTVATGEAAVTAAHETKPALVLMDIMLEGEIDGIRAAAEIRRRFDIPVVFLSAYADEKTLKRAKLTEPYGYLMKPFEEIELRSTIEVALYKHSTDKRLRENEQRYRTLAEAAQDHIFITNADHTVRYMNSRAARSVGFAPDAVVGKPMSALFPPSAMAQMENNMDAVLRSGEAIILEEKLPFPGGELWLSTILTPLKDERGRVTAVMGISRDITGRKKSEEALSRMNRALRTLGKCNEALVRAKSEREFLRESCQAIVSEGSYRMAWVGYSENDEERTVRPVQQCGYEEKYLETVKICWSDTEYGRGPTGTAIRTEKHFVVQNVQTDPRFALWRDEAVKRGYSSIIGLPLTTGETVIGALTIYAAEPEAFDADEVKLLTELANDVAFGIMALRTREAREEAEAQVRRNFDTQTVVNEILRISLSDIELSGILQRTLDLILSVEWLSGESKGCIFLAEGEGRDLVMTVQRNMSEHTFAACSRVLHGACLCGRAASTKTIVFAGRTDARHDLLHAEDDHHGHYCVPILQGEVLFGVINIYLRDGHTRTKQDEEFLTAVANALAGIIKRRRTEDERNRLHQELQETFKKVARSQKEWQETFDSITDLVSIHDEHHVIVRANKAFAAHYKLDLREIVNRKCYDLFHHTDSPILNCPHSRSLARNQPVTEEVRDPKTGQILLVSTFPYTFPDSEGRGTIHIARDVTSEREKELRLIMSERLASLGQMASGIAHEINNPLAAIAGCSEGLLNRVRQNRFDPEFFANYLTIINEEIARCKGITMSMLSIVRQTSYVQKIIDVHEVLDKTLEIIGFQGRLKPVDVVKEYDEALPLIYGSEGELKQVFLAIITNALDALEGEGVLTIRTEVAQDTVLIKISDTGPGIPPEHLQKVFEPFFTTKLDKGGTGLGLSIARKIVDSHGGRIEVSTALSRGTTFTIGLPRLSQEETPQSQTG